MSNLTLIAYKPSGESYCRGCLMDRYNSNHSITIGSPEEIVARWGHLLFENTVMDKQEPEYEITLLINGLDPDSDFYDEDMELGLRSQSRALAAKLTEAETERRLKAEAVVKAATARKENSEKYKRYLALKEEFGE